MSPHGRLGGPALKVLARIVCLLLGATALAAITVAIVGPETALTTMFGPVTHQPVSFTTLTPPESPNWYLVCPKDYCATKPHKLSPVYEMTAKSLRDAWMRMVADQPDVTLLHADDVALQYDFVQRSRFLRFPDTISVLFLPRPGGRSTLAIYSRSHYGYSDLGVNRQRVESWLANLRP